MMNKLKYLLLLPLVAVTAYAGSTLFLSYLDPKRVGDLPLPPAAKSSVEKTSTPSFPLADCLKAESKGSLSSDRKEDTSKTTGRVQEEPPLISLNLKLLGTVVNEKGSSCAIIQDRDRARQDLVSVGSVVAGAKVVSIAKDRVVLKVNGKEQVLLPGAEQTRSASLRGDQGAKESTTSTYVLDREVLRENLDNLPAVLMQARAEPYLKEGRAEGFQLSQIQQGSILRSVGFRDGDVIRSVNGRGIRSLEDAIELYRKLGDSEFYTIGILRNEKPKILHVKIK